MAKFRILILFFLAGFTASAQYTPMASFGYLFKRLAVDSTLQIPSFCGTPTLRNSTLKSGALAMDTCANKLYKWTNANGWSEVAGGGGGSQNLQSVTDVGNSTTNSIDITAPGYLNRLEYDKLNIYGDAEAAQIQLNINSGVPYFSIFDAVQNTYFYNNQIVQGTETSHYPINNGSPDTLATLANIRSEKIDTANKWVNNITRTPGKDSIIYYIGTTRYAIKDSVGAGGGQNGRFGNDTATVVMAKVHNDAGVTLTNGKVVFLSPSGTNSDAPSVRLANNKADSTSANTFGFVSGTIAVNDTGYVILSGKIEKLNTSAFSNGDIIYLDSVSGNWTKSKPSGPYHLVYLGAVVKANAGNGSIFVKPQNGYEVDELHDVKITSKTNNDVLAYESATNLWKNKQISTVLGYTPIAPTDTASMLTNYAKNSTVALKVNISDTASMLTNYAKNSAVALKVNISDTAAMLSKYQRIITAVKYSDTAAMLTNYQRKDTNCFYLISDANTSNTTATNTNLTFAIGANETYRIMIAGTASKASTTTGLKIAIGAPTGCGLKAVIQGGQALASTALQNQILSAVNTLSTGAFATGAGVEVPFRLEGVITNGANAGSITLQFATVTSNTATIYAGTVMQLIRIKGL